VSQASQVSFSSALQPFLKDAWCVASRRWPDTLRLGWIDLALACSPWYVM
jgi:hypothetical protein